MSTAFLNSPADMASTASTTKKVPVWRRIARAWDRISIYMPLLLMGALALGTYWMVRNTPVFGNVEVAKPVEHKADYFMRNFNIKSYDDAGALKSEIYGTEVRHYPDDDTLEIDQGRIRNVDASGRVTTSTANRVLSNGDGSEVQLIGNAVVVREASKDAAGQVLAPIEFRSEFLHVFVNEERVKSNKPVVMTRGSDRFTGNEFAYNNLDGIANLNGRVRGLLMPGSAGKRAAP